MLNGQKVVKVFTHEEKSKEEFNKLNDMLNDDMYKANKYANILMPIANNLGNLQYVLIAIVGTYLTLTGKITLTVGTIVSFLQLTRNFSQSINQVMNNLNAKIENGKLVETSERTGMWAWKHPHHDGKIRYDGININKIKKSDLRRSLGMVLQDVNLFTGTIKENIKYGNQSATDEEVKQAAKLANADGFIERLPNGYNTMLSGNGAQLSQGQRQLISIARVAINNPPVMILDEATSSIDTRTEKIVQDGMDHGKIIERGNHEELMAEKENIINYILVHLSWNKEW